VRLQVIEGDIGVSEPRGGEERGLFVEDPERWTEHAKRLPEEIERQRHEAERQGHNVTAPTAEQLKKRNRTETPQVAA
jgi:hypothetical protein